MPIEYEKLERLNQLMYNFGLDMQYKKDLVETKKAISGLEEVIDTLLAMEYSSFRKEIRHYEKLSRSCK